MQEDAPLAAIEMMGSEASDALTCTMFVADFSSQFAMTLGLQPVSYRQLHAALTAEGVLSSREALWDLYESLMRFLLNVRPLLPCSPLP